MFRAEPVFNRVCYDKMQQRTHEIHRQKLNSIQPTLNQRYYTSEDAKISSLNKGHLSEERCTEIERQNRFLLKRITHIMGKGNLSKSKQNPIKSLNEQSRKQHVSKVNMENDQILKRIKNQRSYFSVVRWEHDFQRNQDRAENISVHPFVLKQETQQQIQLQQPQQADKMNQYSRYQRNSESVVSNHSPELLKQLSPDQGKSLKYNDRLHSLASHKCLKGSLLPSLSQSNRHSSANVNAQNQDTTTHYQNEIYNPHIYNMNPINQKEILSNRKRSQPNQKINVSTNEDDQTNQMTSHYYQKNHTYGFGNSECEYRDLSDSYLNLKCNPTTNIPFRKEPDKKSKIVKNNQSYDEPKMKLNSPRNNDHSQSLIQGIEKESNATQYHPNRSENKRYKRIPNKIKNGSQQKNKSKSVHELYPLSESSFIRCKQQKRIDGLLFEIEVRQQEDSWLILAENIKSQELKVIQIPKDDALEFLNEECEGSADKIPHFLRLIGGKLFLIGKEAQED